MRVEGDGDDRLEVGVQCLGGRARYRPVLRVASARLGASSERLTRSP
jgi:hypothetical protein